MERDGLLLMPARVEFEAAGGSKKDYFVLEDEIWNGRIQSAPLLQRGWVIQEQILVSSTRTFPYNVLTPNPVNENDSFWNRPAVLGVSG